MKLKFAEKGNISRINDKKIINNSTGYLKQKWIQESLLLVSGVSLTKVYTKPLLIFWEKSVYVCSYPNIVPGASNIV